MGVLPCLPMRLHPATGLVLASLVLASLALGGCGSGSRSESGSDGSAKLLNFDGATFPPGVKAHDFTLSGQHGQRVSLSDYKGQVVALVFLPVPSGASTDCRACVLVAQQVRGALEELSAKPGEASGVKTIFVNTNPRPLRARVGALLTETSLIGRVEFLTGSEAELRAALHAYAIPQGADKATSEASITVLLIDRHGFERVGFGLEQVTPEGISHDIGLLLGT